MIHNMREINNIEKFHYLIYGLIRKETKSLLQNFTVSDKKWFRIKITWMLTVDFLILIILK